MILRSRLRPDLRSALLILGLLVLVTGCTPDRAARSDTSQAGYRGGTELSEAYAMPDLSLTDTSGWSYNVATSPSQPVTLMFFGYTHCPDVCVAVLADLATALQGLPAAERSQLQVVFVTTDPDRDRAAPIRAYLDRFDPSFIGLTGDLGDIKTLARQVGVDIEGRRRLADGGYEVGHSAQVIGFERRRGVVIWTPGTSIADLRHDFGVLVARAQTDDDRAPAR